MKLYVLDDNGSVVFEFSDTDGGMQLFTTRSKIIMLLYAALSFLQRKEK